MKKLLFLMLAAISFAGCKKETKNATADFSFLQGSNGLVTFTNLSEHTNSYQWSFGDGTSSTESNPYHKYSANGNYTVTLTSGNLLGGKTASTSKVVAISNINTTTTGQVVVWTSNSQYGQIAVKINGENVGTITQYSSNGLEPSCGANGFVTIDRPAGFYTITATSLDGNLTWSAAVAIVNGFCQKKEIY